MTDSIVVQIGNLETLSKQATEAMRSTVKFSKVIRVKLDKHRAAGRGHLEHLHSTVILKLSSARHELSGAVYKLRELRGVEGQLNLEKQQLCDQSMPGLRVRPQLAVS